MLTLNVYSVDDLMDGSAPSTITKQPKVHRKSNKRIEDHLLSRRLYYLFNIFFLFTLICVDAITQCNNKMEFELFSI